MNRIRCPWANGHRLLQEYHDTQWGVPVHDDKKHFEFLVLESSQAGLSWLTILKRRAGYRALFDNFDPEKVATYDQTKIEQLLADTRIIRNRLKVLAAVNNAQKFIKIQEEFGSFDNYCWRFCGGKPIQNKYSKQSDLPATTEQSDAFSKDLKKRGFKFIGSTIIYAYMQAVGMVNDHLVNCFCYQKCVAKAGHSS